MTTVRQTKTVRVSCVFTLAGLVLMVVSLLFPTPIPVIVAMSLGQLLGTIGFGLYVVAILSDLRASRVLGPGDPPRGGIDLP